MIFLLIVSRRQKDLIWLYGCKKKACSNLISIHKDDKSERPNNIYPLNYVTSQKVVVKEEAFRPWMIIQRGHQ